MILLLQHFANRLYKIGTSNRLLFTALQVADSDGVLSKFALVGDDDDGEPPVGLRSPSEP